MTTPNAIDLTNLNDTKAQLRITDNTSDALIQAMITAYSAFIIKYLSVNFAATTYTEVRSGVGGSYGTTMAMKNTPIMSVTSVTIGTQVVPLSTSVAVSGYTFDERFIYLRGGYYFYAGVQNVTIVYAAGFDAVPYDIEQCCIELVCYKYRELNRVGQSSTTMGGQTIAYSIADVPPTVLAILDTWKEVAIFI